VAAKLRPRERLPRPTAGRAIAPDGPAATGDRLKGARGRQLQRHVGPRRFSAVSGNQLLGEFVDRPYDDLLNAPFPLHVVKPVECLLELVTVIFLIETT